MDDVKKYQEGAEFEILHLKVCMYIMVLHAQFGLLIKEIVLVICQVDLVLGTEELFYPFRHTKLFQSFQTCCPAVLNVPRVVHITPTAVKSVEVNGLWPNLKWHMKNIYYSLIWGHGKSDIAIQEVITTYM